MYCTELCCTKPYWTVLYCLKCWTIQCTLLYCIIMYCTAVGWRRSTICSSTGTVRSSRQQHRSTSLIPGQCSSIHLFIISFALCLFIHFLLIYSYSSFYHPAIHLFIHSFIHLFIHSYILSYILSLNCWTLSCILFVIFSFIFIHPIIHYSVHPIICSFIHLSNKSLINSFTQSVIHFSNDPILNPLQSIHPQS